MLLYAVALASFIAIDGIPRSADWVFAWVVFGLVCSTSGSLSDRWRGVVRDWLPLLAIVLAYDLLRGSADHLGFHSHLTPQLAADRVLGLHLNPTVRLQRAFWNPLHPHWWDYAAVSVYVTHFFGWVLTAAILWHRERARFKQFVRQLLILTFLGFATYVAYPAVPPWLANFQGHLDGVTRIVPAMWNVTGVHTAAAVFESGSHYANDVAAVPSLHAGYACLIALFFWPRSGPWKRVLLGAYTLGMGLALVYLGEHFLVDVLLGWAYAAVAVHLAGRRWRTAAVPPAVDVGIDVLQLDVVPLAQ
jgi:membrane-associated phospholipid phosphatase